MFKEWMKLSMIKEQEQLQVKHIKRMEQADLK